ARPLSVGPASHVAADGVLEKGPYRGVALPGFPFLACVSAAPVDYGVVRGVPDSGVPPFAAAITGRTRRDHSWRRRRRNRVLLLHGPCHRSHEQYGSPGPPRGAVGNHTPRG